VLGLSCASAAAKCHDIALRGIPNLRNELPQSLKRSLLLVEESVAVVYTADATYGMSYNALTNVGRHTCAR
jgi:hypothetical protein